MKIPQFQKKLTNLVKYCNERLANDVQFEAKNLLVSGHKKGEDPYGKGWGTSLIKTGNLLNSYSTKINKNTLFLQNKTDYSLFIQKGTKYMDAKMLLPERKLPDSFKELLEQFLNKQIKK